MGFVDALPPALPKDNYDAIFTTEAGARVLSLRADRFQKLPGDVHMPRLVGMDAIPGDGAGMHVDKERVPGALQVDEDEPVPLRETPYDLAVRVHPRAHGVGAVWLHEVRRHQDHALDVGQGALDQALIGALVFLGRYVLFRLQRGVELTPDVVDADEHADPIGRKVQHIRLPSRLKVAHLIAADAHVDHAKMQLRVHAGERRADIRYIAGTPGVEEPLADRAFAVEVGDGIADEDDFVSLFKEHV